MLYLHIMKTYKYKTAKYNFFFIFLNVLANYEDFNIMGKSFDVENAINKNIVVIKNNI